MKLVVAATFLEARNWAEVQSVPPQDWLYVDTPESLLGHQDCVVIFLDGWTTYKSRQIIELIVSRARFVEALR